MERENTLEYDVIKYIHCQWWSVKEIHILFRCSLCCISEGESQCVALVELVLLNSEQLQQQNRKTQSQPTYT